MEIRTSSSLICDAIPVSVQKCYKFSIFHLVSLFHCNTYCKYSRLSSSATFLTAKFLEISVLIQYVLQVLYTLSVFNKYALQIFRTFPVEINYVMQNM